jgi:hypothetical protein
MDIQSSKLNAIFTLAPIFVPGWLTPVKPSDLADGGIPWLLANGNALGTLCVVDPWTELQLRQQTMAAYDSVALFIGDAPTPVASAIVQPGQEQERIALYVPQGKLAHGVNRLHYKVTRLSGNVEPSRNLLVLYHQRVPASLNLVIPDDVVTSGVSAARAAQGVEFRLDYITVEKYDTDHLKVGNQTFALEVSDPSKPVTITLYTEDFKKIGDGQFQIDFDVTDQLGNSAVSTTKILDVHVGQAEEETLLPPFLVKPAVSPIDVLASAAGVTVRFEHLAARTEDKGRLWEEDALPGSPPFPLVQFNSNKRVNTLLSQAYLAARHGKTIELRWNLNRDGGRVGQSPPMTFSVLRIADGDSRLPIPNIAGETGVVLDVMELTDDAKIFAAKWSFQTEGLPLWLKLDGIDNDGRPVSLPIRMGEPHLSADGLEIPINVNWLRKLKDRSELTVVVRVGLDKQSTEESAVRLPLRSYSIKTFAIPTFEDFSSVGVRRLPINSPVDINSMILTTLAPSTSQQDIGQSSPFPGKIDGYVLILGLTETRAKLRMDFKFSYSKVTFWYYHANLIVIAESFDSEGNLLEKIELNQRSLTQISFSKPGIKRIEFDNNLNQNRACFLDSFELTP